MPAKRSPSGILVRGIQFEYPDALRAHWNPAMPEWSQVVNAGSLGMPYLEPYLIDSIRKACERIEDPALREEAKAYMGQEAHHFKQHRKFNELLMGQGYEELRGYEKVLEEDYRRFAEERSLQFNLAYAAGFETMALAIGHMLIADREFLFGNADPAVSSLILWHFVEELEHKNATFDVYQYVYGGYFYRVYGLFFATFHIMWRTRQAYLRLLSIDGLWPRWRSRWKLWRLLARIFSQLIPKLLRHTLPWHHPSHIEDPSWARDWVQAYDRGEERLKLLDTARIELPLASLLAGTS